MQNFHFGRQASFLGCGFLAKPLAVGCEASGLWQDAPLSQEVASDKSNDFTLKRVTQQALAELFDALQLDF